MHLIDIAGKDKDQRRKSKVFLDKPSFLKRIKRSIVARINIRFWNLRFRSGASTRSLVFSYNFVWECQPEVSYFSFLSYDSIREYQPGVSYVSFIFYDSVREHQSEVSYFSFLSYDSIWEYQLGVSYVSFIFYDFVRERQPGVSYFSYDSTREMWQSLELKF